MTRKLTETFGFCDFIKFFLNTFMIIKMLTFSGNVFFFLHILLLLVIQVSSGCVHKCCGRDICFSKTAQMPHPEVQRFKLWSVWWAIIFCSTLSTLLCRCSVSHEKLNPEHAVQHGYFALLGPYIYNSTVTNASCTKKNCFLWVGFHFLSSSSFIQQNLLSKNWNCCFFTNTSVQMPTLN